MKKIVVEHLGVEADKVSDSASFIDDLGADSLDITEMVMAFEEEFGCEIPDDAADCQAEHILTVGDAVKFLVKAEEDAKRNVTRSVEMPGISSIVDAEKAIALGKTKGLLLDNLQRFSKTTTGWHANEWDVSHYIGFSLKFQIHTVELRALVEKELRDQIAKIDEQLREMGIDPDA